MELFGVKGAVCSLIKVLNGLSGQKNNVVIKHGGSEKSQDEGSLQLPWPMLVSEA